MNLATIANYIKYELCNPISAFQFMSEIRKSILILQEFPHIGLNMKRMVLDLKSIKIF